jgi:hypothetical protein
MTPKFSVDEIVFNRNTNEKGTVGRAYESDGITMYEVRLAIDSQEHSGGSNISDWEEGALEHAPTP